MSEQNSYIEVKQITKKYPSRIGIDTLTVLNELSLSVTRGESIAIMGASGCGKSTLLNIIGTLDSCDSGSVYIEGKSLQEMQEPELAGLRNNTIGIIFQMHHLLPQLTAQENILVSSMADGKKVTDNQIERSRILLSQVGLENRAAHFPSELSGGECQRVAIARALMNNPGLLLADEPTGSLDETSATSILDLIGTISQEEQLTTIMVTHDRQVADVMGKRYRLTQGRLQSE